MEFECNLRKLGQCSDLKHYNINAFKRKNVQKHTHYCNLRRRRCRHRQWLVPQMQQNNTKKIYLEEIRY